MTPDQFRRLALALPESSEGVHMAHPDYRVRNRIFATLGYLDANFGMVRLTPDQQHDAMQCAPEAFRPAAGAWGRSGSTLVSLAAITSGELRPFLRQAYDNIAGHEKRRRRAN